MGFDIIDAYENIKQLREENNYLIVVVDFLKDKLISEGIFEQKEIDKLIKEKLKASD